MFPLPENSAGHPICLREKSLVIKQIPITQKFCKNTSNDSSNDLSTINSGIVLDHSILKNFISLIKNFPGMVSWKTRDSTFLGCSERLAYLGKLRKAEDIYGKKDTDLPWGRGGYAEIFRKEDEEVLNGYITFVLGKYTFADREHVVLVKKVPVLDHRDQITGIFNYIMEFDKSSISNIISVFVQMNIDITIILLNALKDICIEKKPGDICLTSREEECLYFILKGLSTKEVGKALKLSPRTVEFHIENIKKKFKCRKLSSVIIKAAELGYLHDIPSSILLNDYIPVSS